MNTMAAPTAAAFVEESLKAFRYGTKTITGKSGKTYTVPMVQIPAGALLYSATPHKSGFKNETADDVDTQGGMWLSWIRDTALVYSNEGPYWWLRNWFDLRTFTTKRDLDLLDLWTTDGWNAVFQEAEANGYFEQQAAFSGIKNTSESFVQQALDTGMFPGAKCIDPPPPATPCKTMEWKGLPWGAERGQFKRSSDKRTDTMSLAMLYACFGPGTIDGIFDRPLPSPDAQYTSEEKPYKVFHEEINLRPPFSEKLLVHDPKTKAIADPQPDPSEFGGPFRGRGEVISGSVPPAPAQPASAMAAAVASTVIPAETWKTLAAKLPPPPPPPSWSGSSSSSSGFENEAPSSVGFGNEAPSSVGFGNEAPSSSGFSNAAPASSGFSNAAPSGQGRKTRRNKKSKRRSRTKKQ